MQLIAVLNRVPRLVPHDAHALRTRGAFDVEDLVALEAPESRMREVEGHRETGHAAGREPLVGEPHVRLEHECPRVELLVELRDARFQPRSLDGDAEVLEADPEESFVAE